MAYQSSHTGPEVDAAVEMLSQIQDARDATAEDRAEVQVDAQEVHANAVRVAAQTETVNNQAAMVQTLATEVEQAHFDTVTVAATAVQARDIAVSSASAAQASQTSATASEQATTAAAQQAADAADIVSALAPQVSDDADSAQQSATSAAASAASAAAVVTGGTATLTPAAGKIPLADGNGKIADGWLGTGIARSDAVAAATQAAALATTRTAPFLNPAASNPSTRFDGSPLQVGDRYFNTTAQGEYLYTSAGWVLNDATAAVDQVEQRLDTLEGQVDTRLDAAEGDITALELQVTSNGSATSLASDLANAADAAKGAGLVSFSRSNSYAAGTVGKHLLATVSVTDAPYNATNSGDSTAAFQAAYNAVVEGGTILVPAPGPYTVSGVTGTKEVVWEVQFNTNNNLSLLNLPGTVLSKQNESLMLWRNSSQPNEFANLRLDRTANYTGGTVGAVSSNIRAKTTAGVGTKNFEWVATFQLDNNGEGQNVAVYGQGNRRSDSTKTLGGTFASTFEARDFTLEANPTTGLIACEQDILANGTDANGLRVGLDMVVGKGVSTGALCEAGYGIRIGASHNDPTQGYWAKGIQIQNRKGVGLRIIGQTDLYSFESVDTAVAAHRLAGTYSDSAQIIEGTAVVGTRYSGTYTNNNAIRFNSGMAIAWEQTAAIRQLFASGRMQFVNAGTEKTGFDTTTGAMFVVGTQVVGPRKTGWATPTGTLSRAAYDTSSVTLPTLAGVVAAMITDLKSHGLLGT